MPKKKANPFLMFMLEIKSQEENKGRKFRGMDHVRQHAGPLWEKMSKESRAPYVIKARMAREGANETDGKITSVGVPFNEVDAQNRDVEERKQHISDRLTTMIKEAVGRNALGKLEFYFIAFEYFCEMSDGRVIPAEMGVVRYSLQGGVMDKFHIHINPGNLPLGYALAAQNQSELYHKLPLPPNALGETNYETIAFRLFEYMSKNGADMPLLFTDSDDLPKVEKMLGEIVDEIDFGIELLVCPLAELFYQLKKTARKICAPNARNIPTVQALQILITNDVYDFTLNISCKYHEDQGNGKYCALSRCVRWAYVISDCCCTDLNIDLQPGKHLPQRADMGVDMLETSMQSLSLFTTTDDQVPGTSAGSFFGTSGGSQATLRQGAATGMIMTGGRGSRLKLDASREVVRSGMQGAGRAKKLGIDDFPPLASSRHTFK